MKNHNTNLDLLRVVSAFAVIWLHVSAGIATTNPDVSSFAWWTGNVADAFSRWCVPVFVMISGALLLANPANSSPLPFYQKRAARLLVPIAFWSVIYLIYRAYSETGFTWGVAAKSVVTGAPYFHLWYLYMVIGLYLFAPFLRALVSALTPKALGLLVLLCLTLAAIDMLLEGQRSTFLTWFIPYIGYFVAGYYLLNQGDGWRGRKLALIFLICGLFIAAVTALLYPMIGSRSWNLMYHYLNPFVAIMAICLFLLLAKKVELRPIPMALVNLLAPLSFGIYLIHPLWMRVLDKLAITGFLFHPLFGIPAMTLSAFVLSALTAAMLLKIPFLRRTI
ncbi:MAG: hypothetical protein H6R18_1065 [Proteobacteria bacterium]|nr:hypothetical protein [Pseudomonadota bacterium]